MWPQGEESFCNITRESTYRDLIKIPEIVAAATAEIR